MTEKTTIFKKGDYFFLFTDDKGKTSLNSNMGNFNELTGEHKLTKFEISVHTKPLYPKVKKRVKRKWWQW